MSRGSNLAKIQSRIVGDKIKEKHPKISVTYHTTNVKADMDTSMSISNSGEVGMFTKDISKKIIDRKFDLAIHSWKDLPIEPSKETEIIGTLERGDIRDVLLI